MKYLFCFLLSLFYASGFSQLSFTDIDFSRIPQKKLRHYMRTNVQNRSGRFSDLRPSCTTSSSSSELYSMQNNYLLKESPDKVWEAYMTANMARAWNGRIISFGMLCSKWSDYVLYRNDNDFCGIDTGQVFFINLRILCGLYNLPVGVQIVEIDEESRKITFSYLEGGKSIGTQIIRLIETDLGFTRIVHESAFKSGSRFRDKRLYPFYHTRVLNEFHRNIAGNIADDEDFFLVLSSSPPAE